MSTKNYFINTLWEGVFGADFTLANVRQRCASLGAMLRDRGWSCLIAYDARFMSDLFARDIYHHLERQDIQVSLVSMLAPLPAIHYALQQKQADCALIVSARNRPYWYNGLVVLTPESIDPFSQSEGETKPQEKSPYPFPMTSETVVQQDTPSTTPGKAQELRTPYLEMLRGHIDTATIRRSTMTIFVDPMHGTTAGYIPSIIGGETQSMAIEINRETDPLFDRFTPLPATASLVRLRKLVRESDSHIGLAFSADGTALAIVDKNGEQLDYVEIALLLASYLVHQYRQKGVVIAPLSKDETMTMSGLEAWQKSLNITVELTANSTNRIGEMLAQKDHTLLVGCTPEGEIVLGHYSLYPDALLAGLIMVEQVARSGGSLRSLLDELRSTLSKP